jgi:hypothetical protein
MQSPRPAVAAVTLALAFLFVPFAGRAEVLSEGKPKGGFYWQKVSQSNGIRYLCRSTTDAKIQKASL